LKCLAGYRTITVAEENDVAEARDHEIEGGK
jgi:hypothetical protein